jgi:hypothetical protein
MNSGSNKKHNLNILTVDEIKQAYEYQKKNGDWTFYQEREFEENLLQTRFNYLITVYTLFLWPFFQAKEKDSKIVILLLGLIIVGIMGLVVYRMYVKFDIIMKILHKLDEYHVLRIQDKEVKTKKRRLFNVNPFIGYVIPLFLFLSIIIMGILLIVFDFKFL